MKTHLISGLLALLSLTGCSQALNFNVHGVYARPLSEIKVKNVKYMADIIPNYPASWIEQYVSVEIEAIKQGKVYKAISANDTLSAEQINILNAVDLDTDVIINVNYKAKNSVTENLEDYKIHTKFTVVPTTEAQFVGGKTRMTAYLEESAIGRISNLDGDNFNGIVRFTINEKGRIVNVKLTGSTKDTETDQIIYKAITNMPKWKPARNAKGVAVKQDFEFYVGKGGGC